MMVINQVFKLRLAWRLFLARLHGVECGEGVRLARDVDFNLGGGFHNCLRPPGTKGVIQLGPHSWIEQGSVLWAHGGAIKLGPSVFLGPYVAIYGHGGVEIGANTLVAMHATIVSSNHGIPPRSRPVRDEPDELLPVKIGRDCWLGAGAIVLGGVTIGNGCVIGAGTVVTRDLPPFSVAVGVPARITGSRPD